MYRLLVENNIPVPTHIIISRDGLVSGEDPPGFVETVRSRRERVKKVEEPVCRWLSVHIICISHEGCTQRGEGVIWGMWVGSLGERLKASDGEAE